MVAGPDGVPALPPGPEAMVTVNNVEGQLRASMIAKLAELVDKHPDESLVVIRRWIAPEERP
jgi:flagellar M-ring protein FliF